MFKTFNIINVCVKNVQNCSARSINFKSAKKLISIYFRETSETAKPPYDHICQVGNPVLRQKAAPVDPNIIQTQEFQKTLDYLYEMMQKSDTLGLAAPQIGLSYQVFAMEIKDEFVQKFHPYLQKSYNIKTYPLTYFINPKLKITNPEEIILFEMCASIENCVAEVARPKEVQIDALNRFGEPFSLKLEGWLARVVQHETDHLKGILYTERMFPLTFEYSEWTEDGETNQKVTTN